MIAIAIACGMLVLLSGCRIPNFCPAEPGAPLPASFNGVSSPESAAQIPVEEFFNDPTLTCLIREALAGNQQLKILAQDIRIANTEVLARRGALFPFVTIRTEAGLDKHSLYTPLGAAEKELTYPNGRHFPDPLPDFLVAANFNWQIDIWRKLRNARDAAALRFLATGEGRNYVVTRVVAQVAESYYRLMALDKRLENLDNTIELQEQSLKIAIAKKAAGRGTELAVQRFQAEVRKNQSEKLIVKQEIIEAENRINFLAGRFPQPVPRATGDFINLNLNALSVGVPSQLLLNRPDIREAERNLEAAGLDVKVARAEFFPSLVITGDVGFEAFSPKYLFNPEAFMAHVVGGLVTPLVNRTAIQAVYGSANARQLQSVYSYQRIVLDAFTEVVNRVSMAENYRRSIEIKKQQLEALQASVESASKLFQNARVEYVEVLLAQRELLEAKIVLIETKNRQLSAIVNAYQALGGGLMYRSQACPSLAPAFGPLPRPEPTPKDPDPKLPISKPKDGKGDKADDKLAARGAGSSPKTADDTLVAAPRLPAPPSTPF